MNFTAKVGVTREHELRNYDFRGALKFWFIRHARKVGILRFVDVLDAPNLAVFESHFNAVWVRWRFG